MSKHTPYGNYRVVDGAHVISHISKNETDIKKETSSPVKRFTSCIHVLDSENGSMLQSTPAHNLFCTCFAYSVP
jgi:hypothetical protein